MNYRFVLVDTETGQEVRQWVLSPPVVIGRGPSADIDIDNPSISRRHCQFWLDPYGALMVRDLGSKNGVYVDQRRVEKATVRPGTDIRIGTIALRAELTSEELDEIERQADSNVYDLAETERVRIVRPDENSPDDDVFEIG